MKISRFFTLVLITLTLSVSAETLNLLEEGRVFHLSAPIGENKYIPFTDEILDGSKEFVFTIDANNKSKNWPSSFNFRVINESNDLVLIGSFQKQAATGLYSLGSELWMKGQKFPEPLVVATPFKESANMKIKFKSEKKQIIVAINGKPYMEIPFPFEVDAVQIGFQSATGNFKIENAIDR